MKKITIGALVVCFIAGWANIWGQETPKADESSQRRPSEFERRSPSIGERLPDVEVYDAQGNRFRLSVLRGHYTVLVFGCLT